MSEKERARETEPILTSNRLYPQRVRCLGCRKYFGPIVIKRLYCSYACAGMEPPPADIMQRPRYCRTHAGELKRSFFYPEQVTNQQLTCRGMMDVYYCDCCGTYHIGYERSTYES
jgi:hypothetical protein